MKLPFDKKLHIVFGFFIGMLFMLVSKDYGMNQNAYMAISSIAVAVFAIGKEVYDKLSGKGTFEKLDALYTMFAGWGGIIFYDFIKTII